MKDQGEFFKLKRRVALPTLLFFLLIVTVTWVTIYGALSGVLSEFGAVVALVLCSYAMFTVLHESTHCLIFQSKTANTIIGTLASVWMGPTSSYSAYRALHMEHHRFTNNPEKDPDYYNGRGPRWWLPISWLTTDIYYYYFYLSTSAKRSLGERIKVVIENVIFLAILIVLCMHGHSREALLYWIFPARVTTFLLSLGFNFLPHWPHETSAEKSQWDATRNLGKGGASLSSILLMGHDLHQVHHLNPDIPFYMYGKAMRSITGNPPTESSQTILNPDIQSKGPYDKTSTELNSVGKRNGVDRQFTRGAETSRTLTRSA